MAEGTYEHHHRSLGELRELDRDNVLVRLDADHTTDEVVPARALQVANVARDAGLRRDYLRVCVAAAEAPA